MNEQARAIDPSKRWKTLAVLAICGVLAAGLMLEQAFDVPQQRKEAPDVSFVDQQGHRVRLSDYRGRPVLVNFWATWCPPCVQEVPSLERTAARLKTTTPDLVILAPAVGDDWKAVNAFAANMGIKSFTVLEDDKAGAKAFGTFKLPETWVVSREGEILKRYVSAQNWTDPEIVDYLEHL